MRRGPPRRAVQLLGLLLPAAVRAEALAELRSLYVLRARRDGRRAADRWYWLQLPAFAWRVRLAALVDGSLDGVGAVGRQRAGGSMRGLGSDIRYGTRALLRNPVFALIAVLTLALGIGANTAIFSVIRSVLLRPLPFPQADRVVGIWETRLDRGWDRSSFTYANFWDVRDMNRTFDAVGAFAYTTINLTGFEYPERLSGGRVSAGFFAALGVAPVVGRMFAAGDDEAGAETRLVVLSHDLWARRFGSDPGVVGRTITLDNESYTVIGVLPRGRPWLDAADVFLPLIHRADADRDSFELEVVGRMKPGVTMAAAEADLQRVAARLAELYPEPDKGMGIGLGSSADWVADETLRRALWILMGGVGILLLIACVNLANLLLARATGQARERALRAALGASTGRIVRLVLTESMLMSLLGAMLGLGLAWGMVQLLRALNPEDLPQLAEVTIDGWVLGFTLVTALATGILTGTAPALRSARGDLVPALREGERSVAGSRRQGRLRGVLVGVEIAMSLVLLVGAGLLVRSFGKVLSADRGFATEDRVFFEVAVPSSYDGARTTQFLTQFLGRVRGLNGVESAAAVNVRPLRGVNVGMGFAAADKPVPPGDAVPWASWRLITPGYLATMGVTILAGRDFADQDMIGSPWRVIISKSIADRLWPGENAVGRTLILWKGQSENPAEVIGVAADMRDWGLETGPSLATYLPYYGAGFSPVQFVLHTRHAAGALTSSLRAALREIDANLPLSRVQTLDTMVGASVASRRFTMFMLLAFAAVALVLALAGVYGVLSYSVAKRRSEIGMRIALGASRGSVLRLVVMQGMRPVVAGLVLGVAGALALSRLMTSLLFEITPADALTYVGVATVLLAAAALSCYLPARRATRLNVVSALREE